LNELAVILANNPDVQMGAFTSDFSVALQDYFVQHGSAFKLHDSVLAASSKFPLSEVNPLKEFVGSVIETIEGIDREFKVTKAQKVSFYNKSGGYTSFRGYENHSFKFNAELKSHYELVGRSCKILRK
jgi:hypothetical protein